MKKKQNILTKLTTGMNPVMLGELGLILLCLPIFVPIENKSLDNAMFISAMALLLYASGCAIANEIKVAKMHSDKEIKRQVEEEIAKRKKEIYAKRNIKQK